MASKDWGKIFISTRLEKQVEPDFFTSWTGLMLRGKRKGDVVYMTRGKVAHVAQNDNVRAFLVGSDCETFLSLDSDATFDPDFLNRFRDYEPGWQYDALQAFYTRRGEPLEAIWMLYNPLNNTTESGLVLSEGEQELGLIGTHCALFRREIFEQIYRIYGEAQGIPFNRFEWFTYPRHEEMSDESQLAHEARELGFRLGGTTAIKVGHVGRQIVGWNEYQEHLTKTNARERAEYYLELRQMVADFTGETVEEVHTKALQGSGNVKTAWEKANPQTPDEVRAFYGQADNGYLYDLLAWNWGEVYWKIAAPLREYRDKRVLVIGAGLGTEVEWLTNNNFVVVYEIDGILKEFMRLRFEHNYRVDFLDSFDLVFEPNLIVCVDTLEHIHPNEVENILSVISELLSDDGIFYCHNNFKQQHDYPMHYDHSVIFEQWLQDNELEQTGAYTYQRRAKENLWTLKSNAYQPIEAA